MKKLAALLILLSAQAYSADFNISIKGPIHSNNIVFNEQSPPLKNMSGEDLIGSLDVISPTQIFMATIVRPNSDELDNFKIDIYTREGAHLSEVVSIKEKEIKTFSLKTPDSKKKTVINISRLN